MSTPITQKNLLDTAFNTVCGFWGGWLGGASLLAGGKVWTVLFTNHQKVSDLLGHVGTPLFRREAAVGFAVYMLTQKIFQIVAEKIKIDPNNYQGKAFQVLSIGASAATGSLAATALSHVAYHYVLGGMCILTIALIAKDYIPKLRAS